MDFLSAYEVKNNCCLFESLFKVKKNGVFLLGISFFFVEILTFLYCANEESDDVIGGSTKTVQHSIKNTVSLKILKQCSSNLAPETYITKEKECHLLCHCHVNTLQSLSVKNQNVSICNLLKWDRGSSSEHTWFPYCLNSPH